MQKYRHRMTSPYDDVVHPPNHFRIASRRSMLQLYVKQAEKLLNPTIDSSSVVHFVEGSKERVATSTLPNGSSSGDNKHLQGHPSSAASVGYYTSVSFMAIGRAMPNAITAAEMLKRKMGAPLHQNVVISSTKINNVYEPLEEGLDVIELATEVGVLIVTLATVPAVIDAEGAGYQSPDTLYTVRATRAGRERRGRAKPLGTQFWSPNNGDMHLGKNKKKVRGAGSTGDRSDRTENQRQNEKKQIRVDNRSSSNAPTKQQNAVVKNEIGGKKAEGRTRGRRSDKNPSTERMIQRHAGHEASTNTSPSSTVSKQRKKPNNGAFAQTEDKNLVRSDFPSKKDSPKKKIERTVGQDKSGAKQERVKKWVLKKESVQYY